MASEIIPNLYVGSYSDALDLAYQVWGNTSTGIRMSVPPGWAYIAVTEYQNETPLEPWGALKSPFMGFAPNSDMARIDILEGNARMIDSCLKAGDKVLVHCSHGHERSPLQVAWYLMQYKGMNINDAYDLIIKKHPTAVRRIYWLPFEYRPSPYNGDVFR